MKLKSPTSAGRSDAVTGSDGVTVFKEVRVTAAPVVPTDVTNKAYVDKVAIQDKYLAGDVIIRATSTTPTGFLRCNGAELTKTMYPALYAAIGDTHNVYTVPGSGTPWRNQYGINTVLNGPLTDWVAGNALSASNYGFQLAVTKNRVYIFGRNNGGATSTNTIYTATLNSDGTTSTWATAPVSLPGGITRAQLFTYLGRLYIVGGNNNSDQSNVWRCNINADGTISSFTTLTSLPFTISYHQCAPIQNRVFLGGGYQNGVASAAIHCAVIDANGNFGTWYNSTSLPAIVNFPYAITNHLMTMVNRRGYLIGGLIDGATPTANIYYSEFDDAGNMTEWKQSTPFPETVYNASIIVTNEKVYVMGGAMSNAYSNKIYFAQIRADGSLGSWVSGGTLPAAVSSFRTALTAGKIYIFGGVTSAGASLNTYYVAMPGGLNDYSPYYNGLIGITPVDKFKLPDYTKSDNKSYYFIKY